MLPGACSCVPRHGELPRGVTQASEPRFRLSPRRRSKDQLAPEVVLVSLGPPARLAPVTSIACRSSGSTPTLENPESRARSQQGPLRGQGMPAREVGCAYAVPRTRRCKSTRAPRQGRLRPGEGRPWSPLQPGRRPSGLRAGGWRRVVGWSQEPSMRPSREDWMTVVATASHALPQVGHLVPQVTVEAEKSENAARRTRAPLEKE